MAVPPKVLTESEPIPDVTPTVEKNTKAIEEMGTGDSLPPDTTKQDDMVTAGQRKINLIWEFSQATLALLVTTAVVYTAIVGSTVEVLNNAFFLIVGVYFNRTNHQRIGGTGTKATDNEEYKGR